MKVPRAQDVAGWTVGLLPEWNRESHGARTAAEHIRTEM